MRESRHRSYRPTVHSCWRVRSQPPSFAIVSLSLVQYILTLFNCHASRYGYSERWVLWDRNRHSTHLSVSLIAVPAKSDRTNSGRVSWNGSRHKPKLSLSFIVIPVESDTASGGCRGTEAGTKAFSIFQYRVVERKYVSEKKLECVRSTTAVANAPLHIRQYHHAYTQYWCYDTFVSPTHDLVQEALWQIVILCDCYHGLIYFFIGQVNRFLFLLYFYFFHHESDGSKEKNTIGVQEA